MCCTGKLHGKGLKGICVNIFNVWVHFWKAKIKKSLLSKSQRHGPKLTEREEACHRTKGGWSQKSWWWPRSTIAKAMGEHWETEELYVVVNLERETQWKKEKNRKISSRLTVALWGDRGWLVVDFCDYRCILWWLMGKERSTGMLCFGMGKHVTFTLLICGGYSLVKCGGACGGWKKWQCNGVGLLEFLSKLNVSHTHTYMSLN